MGRRIGATRTPTKRVAGMSSAPGRGLKGSSAWRSSRRTATTPPTRSTPRSNPHDEASAPSRSPSSRSWSPRRCSSESSSHLGIDRARRRHDPQLQRRAHRHPAVHRVPPRPTPTDPPLHLRLRTSRRPRGPLRHLDDHLSAIIAGVEAIRRLISPQAHRPPRLRRRRRASSASSATSSSRSTASAKATRIGSAALVADGYHARTDGFTSLAVVAGAIGVWAGFHARRSRSPGSSSRSRSSPCSASRSSKCFAVS